MTTYAVPTGIVAVIRATSAEEAVAIGSALAEGGVEHVEITFTVPDALGAIRWLALNTAANVGAGTVMTPSQGEAAVEAGATFLVSPSLEPGVVEYATSVGVPAIPGALTPTEISRAISAGASAVKLFPVGSVGGAKYLKTVAEVFRDVPWMVSGGIAAPEVSAYQAAGAASICLGGALIDRDAVSRGDHAALVAHVRRTLVEAGPS